MKKNNFAVIALNKKLIFLLVFISLIVSFGCRSKTIVKKLSDKDSKTETKKIKGSLYHLPLTVIQVSVPFKLKKESPGEFGDLTPCFFNEVVADQRIKVEKKTLSIDKPTFSQFGVADLSETFVVQTTGKYFETRTVETKRNKEGVLTEGKFEVKDETLPTAIKIAETAIGLGTKIISSGGLAEGGQSSGQSAEILGADKLSDVIIIEVKISQLTEDLKNINAELNVVNEALKNKKLREEEKTQLTARKSELENQKATLQKNLTLWQIKATAIQNQKEKIQQREEPPEKGNCYLIGFTYQIKKIERQIAHVDMELSDLTITAERRTELTNTKVKLMAEKADWIKRKNAAIVTWREVIDEDAPDREYLPFVITFRKAQEAKKELDEILGQRGRMQSELANFDPAVYTARLTELDNKIKGLKDKFFGTNETFLWTGNFEFNPSKDPSGQGEKTLLTYSKSSGICFNGTFKTELVNDGIIPDKDFRYDKCLTGDEKLTKLQIFTDRLSADRDFIARIETAKTAMRNQTSGWYFRIPAKTTVGLIECKNSGGTARCSEGDQTEYGRQKMMIAQYGAVVSLPAKTAGRSSSTSVTLDEATGALLNFKASSSPLLDKSTIEGAGKTVEDAIDAGDPLTKKKRELELLETQNKIDAERRKMANPTPSPTP